MRSTLSYMTWPFIVTAIGLALAAALGWQYSGTGSGAAGFFLIAAILAVLEISLSFDNAIVNAQKLKQMTPLWQRRFLTWGIIIAVFGMRVIFPLLVVVIAARLAPWEALRLAATRPQEYSQIIHQAHLPIAAFGGAFLMLVALNYFFDQSKDVDWIVANDVSGDVMGGDGNTVHIVTADGVDSWERMPKSEVAARLVGCIMNALA